MAAGWNMLKQKEGDETRGNVQQSVDPRDLSSRAFYPLTLPLTVGPGSISVAITLGANEPHHGASILFSIIGAVIGSLLIAVSVYFCYAFADRLAQILGPTAMTVIMRLTSFLLVCIGVQIFWNGFSALLSSLPAMAR
jgi:multiple antibiotic resistance protein